MNGCRTKMNEDQHAHEEDPDKKGELNSYFIHERNLTENSHPEC